SPNGQYSNICVPANSAQNVLANRPNSSLGECNSYRVISDITEETKPNTKLHPNLNNLNIAITGETKSNHFKVYPNPNNGELFIDLPMRKPATINLYNLQGQLISKKETNNENRVRLDQIYLSKGIYIVEVIQGMQIFKTKVLIQ